MGEGRGRLRHPAKRAAALRYNAACPPLLSRLRHETAPRPCVCVALANRSRRSRQGLPRGAYAQDITPTKFPISVNGGMQDRQATTAHDRLHARCLVLDDGTTRIAIVVCDSCMIPREVIDEAKAQAQQGDRHPARAHPHLRHAHAHGPDGRRRLPERSGRGLPEVPRPEDRRGHRPRRQAPRAGEDRLGRRQGPDAGLQSPLEDEAGLRPHQTRSADDRQGEDEPRPRGHADLVEPAGPIDPDVSILSVQTADGKPLALLANYSLHYVGGVPALSADYFGVFADQMQQPARRGQATAFVGIMSNGTSGDINNVNFREAGARQAAARRADPHRRRQRRRRPPSRPTRRSSIRDWAVARRWPRRRSSWACACRPPRNVARAKEILAKRRGKKKVLSDAARGLRPRDGAAGQVSRRRCQVILQAIRIGDLGIVANPVRDVRRDRPGDQEEEPAASRPSPSSWPTATTATCRRRSSTRWAATKPGGPGRAIWRWTRRRRSWTRGWSC